MGNQGALVSIHLRARQPPVTSSADLGQRSATDLFIMKCFSTVVCTVVVLKKGTNGEEGQVDFETVPPGSFWWKLGVQGITYKTDSVKVSPEN